MSKSIIFLFQLLNVKINKENIEEKFSRANTVREAGERKEVIWEESCFFFKILLREQYSWKIQLKTIFLKMFHNNILRLWTRRSLWRSTTVCWSGQSLTLCSRSTPRRPLARCLPTTSFASFKTSRRTGLPWSRSARRSSSTFRICSYLTLVLLAFSYIIPIPDR